jgi:hypothetical protein
MKQVTGQASQRTLSGWLLPPLLRKARSDISEISAVDFFEFGAI